MAKMNIKKHGKGGKIKGGMDVTEPADGNTAASTAGPVRTPAPDVISKPRAAKGFSDYGMSFIGPSSLTPKDDANVGRSPLGRNMAQDTAGGAADMVLDSIISKGVGAGTTEPLTGDDVVEAQRVAASQTRKVDATPCKPAFGMRNRSGEV